ILERAPKLPGWEFYPYRLAETPEQTIAAVQARVGVDVTEALLEASVAPGRKIDLRFSFPVQKKKKPDEEAALQAALATTEALLGEQVLDAWIGQIDVLDSEDAADAHPLPLPRAQAAVATLIQRMVEQLPAARAQDISIDKNWATIKLDPPEPADD